MQSGVRGVSRCFLQVLEKLEALQEERDKLEDQWNQKQSWLETVHLEQVFYRDVNSVDKTSGSQEVNSGLVCPPEDARNSQYLIAGSIPPQILLQNSTLGNTVDETEGLIKRHEAFEKLLSSQEDKVCSSSPSLLDCSQTVFSVSVHLFVC